MNLSWYWYDITRQKHNYIDTLDCELKEDNRLVAAKPKSESINNLLEKHRPGWFCMQDSQEFTNEEPFYVVRLISKESIPGDKVVYFFQIVVESEGINEGTRYKRGM